nr:unnamed protein product [Callosobruchus chinensis]
MLSAFLVENNLSFSLTDRMIDLLKSAIPDSNILKKVSLKRTKATAVVKNVLGQHEKERLVDILKKTKFSILTDDSTDISTCKATAIVVSDGNTKCDAETLYNLIINAFASHSIPPDNIIGFASDGCNVMMGSKNSVASRFRENFKGIIILKCICHPLHLCASEACKNLPRTPEDLARNIYNFFKVKKHYYK